MYEYMFMYAKCQCSKKPQEYKFSDKELTSFEERLKLIAVKARIQIMLVLADSPHCVCDITAHTCFSQSLVSHHLADLMKACLVGSKKDGKYVEYFLNYNGQELLKAVEHVSLCCEVNIKKGGDNTMMKGKQGCNCDEEKRECDGGNCCKEETKTEEFLKDELLAKKSELEENLKEVNEALTKSE